MKKGIVGLILIVGLLAKLSLAADTTASFLDNGFGARAAGLGGSYVALVDDSSAVFWNSAGLALVRNPEINTLMYRGWETDNLAAVAAMPFGNGCLGLGFFNSSMPNILYTEADQSIAGRYMFTGNSFSYTGNALFLSYGIAIFPSTLMVGASYKYIMESLGNNHSSGMGLDVGVLYRPFKELSLGVNVQNAVAPKLVWDTPSQNTETMPLNIKAGGSLNLCNDTLHLTTDINYLNISSDKRSVMDNLSVQTGIEYWIIPELAVRVGLSPVKFNPIGLNDSNKLLQSLGLGLKLNSLRFDFSWTNQPANLDIIQIEDVYRFSIGYVFEDDQVRVAEIETPVAQEVNRVATAPVVQRIIPEQTVTKNVVTEDVVATVNENLLEVSLKGPKLLTGEEGTYTYEIKGGSGKEYDVDLHIKDSYGTTVRNLVVERKYDSGKYRVVWGGQDNHLQVLENGEYYLRLFVTCNGKEVATSFMKVVLDK